MLQQLLEVWAVEHARPYDVFELPPGLSANEQRKLETQIRDYSMVVSTIPWPRAWVIGEESEETAVEFGQARRLRQRYEAELKARGWLDR
jgi:hypothetical protein